MTDPFGRTIDYMRVSITDRCNLRCCYCMPRGIETVPMSDILTYEEILEVVRAASQCGITKLKITGGEPLVRRGVPWLVQELRHIPGIQQVTMTTNGTLLAPFVAALPLDGINISLDALDAGKFLKITGFDLLDKVLAGIDAALSVGIPTKINAVLQDDTDWEPLLLLARDRPLDVRFIELMPIGEGRGCRAVDNRELLKKIREKYPRLERDPRRRGNGPATYVRIPGFQGEIGFISALHAPFCASCNRLRLTARGKLRPCLCFVDSLDLKPILRGGGNLGKAIRSAVEAKPAGHKLGMAGAADPMVEIGG